tara:strand:- start:811 stop:1203 length:393 start_codon:yes stop_codon:yes gene_type:complete
MLVYVLLYDSGKDSEGIHSLEISGKTIVLMFENKDDAQRYSVLLEAQDFPCPSIEHIERNEIEAFCEQSGYEPRFVESGFIPKTVEERLSLVPPEKNLDNISWKDDNKKTNESEFKDDLSDIRNRLEELL